MIRNIIVFADIQVLINYTQKYHHMYNSSMNKRKHSNNTYLYFGSQRLCREEARIDISFGVE